MARRRPCTEDVTLGRLQKAIGFLHAATLIEAEGDEATIGDAYVTLCIHAGIAAADAICCRALGRHAQGDSHDEATALLRSVTPGGNSLVQGLAALLAMKTRAEYGHDHVSSEQRRRAGRTAERLVEEARRRV